MIGQIVGRYRILERIGKGGMGEVYLAEDSSLDRKVALKFLTPELQKDVVALKRFIREAKSSAALDHPYICGVHEVSQTEEGQDFIVMEYVPGLTLKERLLQGEIPLKDALRISLEVAEALQAAHKKGIIHRDLKPSNIMLTEGGHAKVMDFGLAKRTEGKSEQEVTDILTKEGKALGTLPYMSPEQALGRPLDGRSDIFSLGVLLYELLTGVNPFHKETRAATSYAILADHPSSVSDYRAGVPVSLEQTVERMLAKDVEERFQDMEDLVKALRNARREHRLLLEGRTASSIEISKPDDLADSKDKKRSEARDSGKTKNRKAWMISAGVVCLALAAGGMWLWPQRCLWAPTWFGECAIPSYKHIGVLDFVPSDPEFAPLTAGLKWFISEQLSLFSQSDNTVCTHGINSASEATLCNLNISGKVSTEGEMVSIELGLWNPGSQLQLRALSIHESLLSIQDDLVSSLAGLAELELNTDAKLFTRRGGTGLPSAFSAYLRGLGYWTLDETDKSIEWFERALAQDPEYASALAALARVQRQQFSITKDQAWLDWALESSRSALLASSDAPLPSAYESLGGILFDRHQFGPAIEALEECLRLNPLNPYVRRKLSEAYLALAEKQKAERILQEGVNLRPKCWYARDILGFFYYRNGQFDRAEKQYRRLLEVSPRNHRGFLVLGGVQYEQERWGEAERSFLNAIRFHPTADAYLNLGQLYNRVDCFEAAKDALEQATLIGKKDFLAWGNKAEAYRMLPQYRSRAAAVFERAIQVGEQRRITDPKNSQLIRQLAFYNARLGRWEKAFEGIQEALLMDPQDIHTMYRAGYLYELAGKREVAIDFLSRSVKGGISTKELCTHFDFEDLRKDTRLSELLAGRCETYRTNFVCPSER